MTTKQKVLSAVTAVTLTAGTLAAANPGGHQRMHRGWGDPAQRIERMSERLELTEAQKENAKQLFADAQAAAKPVREQLKQVREQMSAAVKANNEAEIDRLATQQSSLMAQAAAIRAKGMAKFYAQLTPEQKAKADQMHERMRARFK